MLGRIKKPSILAVIAGHGWLVFFLLLVIPMVISLCCVLFLALNLTHFINHTQHSEPWHNGITIFLQSSGVTLAFVRTIIIGVGSTLLALAGALGIVSLVYSYQHKQRFQRLWFVAYVMPHATVALAFIALFAPVGIFSRIFISTPLPPQFNFAPDSTGMSLFLAVMLKEFIFFSLVIGHYSNEPRFKMMHQTLTSMGYTSVMAWWKGVFPHITQQTRLITIAVMAFALSVVDMPQILLLGNTHTVSTLIVEFSQLHQQQYRLASAGGSLLLAATVALCLLLFWQVWTSLKPRAMTLWLNGKRSSWGILGLCTLGVVLTFGATVLTVGGILLLALRALTKAWRYPNIIPHGNTLSIPDVWSIVPFDALYNAILIATMTASIAAITATIIIESLNHSAIGHSGYHDSQIKPRRFMPSWHSIDRGILIVVFFPLLVPQVIFTFGLQIIAEHLHLPFIISVVIGHLAVVIPYYFFLLREPLRDFDPRYTQIAATMGVSPLMSMIRVKIPMLMPVLLMGMALSMTLSNSQYVPTQMLGGGRIETPTTISVILGTSAAGSQQASVAVIIQSLLSVIMLIIGIWPSYQRQKQRKELR